MDRYREALKKRHIRLVTDETEFKITIQASLNQSVRKIEAWVTLTGNKSDKNKKDGKDGQPPARNPVSPPIAGPGAQEQQPDPGLKITFMRVL